MFKKNVRFIASSLIITGLIFSGSPNGFPFMETKQVQAQTDIAKTYKVKKGDTLYSIAKQFRVSVDHLKAWNGIKNHIIYVGQTVKLSASTSNNNSQSKTYVVKKGDTLYAIGKKNKVTVTNIKKWNGLKTNTIRVGQKLKLQATPTQPTPPTKKIASSSFKTVRYYDTNVHVYTSASNARLAVSKGVTGKYEPLSELKVANEVAKINLGFFSTKKEHLGMYLVNGMLHQEASDRNISLVYGKNGKIDIRSYGNSMSKPVLDTLKKETHFVVGTSYSLVQDGKKNLQNSSKFDHSSQRNPRTMFGQTKDGRFILAVTDGRVKGSNGLTASQSADVMLKLGAVEAVNMDGGGSSTLIVGGKIKNKLDGGQRSIGSALFVTK